MVVSSRRRAKLVLGQLKVGAWWTDGNAGVEGGRSQHGEVSGVEWGEGFRRVVAGTGLHRYAGGRAGGRVGA